MKLNNTQLLNFVMRIKLTAEGKRKYANQIDNLIETVRKGIEKHTDLKVTRVLRAGSWMKGTALRPRDGFALDIDIVFFLDVPPEKIDDLDDLHDTVLDFLVAAYPNKTRDDFRGGEKTVGLVFRGSGLEADLVPVIPREDGSKYVWQPSSKPGDSKFITSVDGQLEFVRSIKSDDVNWTALVRMLKTWRNRQEIPLSSFAIELLAAHLMLMKGAGDNLEDAVIRFFDFVGRGKFDAITFDGAEGGIDASSAGPVYLADPTNNQNNVVERMTVGDWDDVVSEAEKAFETGQRRKG
jgi:hypothetical protein